jgi:hypothetical protein
MPPCRNKKAGNRLSHCGFVAVSFHMLHLYYRETLSVVCRCYCLMPFSLLHGHTIACRHACHFTTSANITRSRRSVNATLVKRHVIHNTIIIIVFWSATTTSHLIGYIHVFAILTYVAACHITTLHMSLPALAWY